MDNFSVPKWGRFRWFHILCFSLAFLPAFIAEGFAQDTRAPGTHPIIKTNPELQRISVVRNDSPRDTISSFLRLRSELEDTLISYRDDKTSDKVEHYYALLGQFSSLLDLRASPSVSRFQVGRDTTAYLLDIFGRIGMPDLNSVPGIQSSDAWTKPAFWRIPGTPIKIIRIDEGPQAGEFLFSERTPQTAPRFLSGIKALPLRSRLGIKSWRSTLLQATGPMIPAWVVDTVPNRLKTTWQGTPIWKVLFVLATSVLAALLINAIHNLAARKETDERIVSFVWQLLPPISMMAAILVFNSFFTYELLLSGTFSRFIELTLTILFHIALAWVFWLGVRLFFEWLILSPHISEESLDANLLRLVAAFIGIVGVIIIFAYGGEKLGLPTLSLLAGLGIGGIAFALAVRPTLENLISGIILYVDKPVRVGDFCSFGDKTGTVEKIGLRSIHIRARDRTLISVPNAQFADLQIVNWAKCDQMLIEETIGLRYETCPEQLRFLLAKLREMLHAHPRIDNDTIRVRFSEYGDSSLNVSIRVYAKTREWNDYYAIREDVLFRVYEVVYEAGSDFAFPSQTLYMSKDDGLNKEHAEAAEEQVKAWRQSSKLPFPRLPIDRLEEIEDTLDYPPRGSPDASGEKRLDPEELHHPVAEPLSAEIEDHSNEEEKQRRTDET